MKDSVRINPFEEAAPRRRGLLCAGRYGKIANLLTFHAKNPRIICCVLKKIVTLWAKNALRLLSSEIRSPADPKPPFLELRIARNPPDPQAAKHSALRRFRS